MTTAPARSRHDEGGAAVEPGGAARPWLVLSAVLAGSFLHTFDMMVISVAVPSIQEGLGAGTAATQWMLAGYTLPFALLLITFGRLGDAVGRRRMILLGSLSFSAASALCAVAADPAVLIAGRVWQGASAAALTPQVLPVIVLLFGGKRRGAALGAQAGVIALATVSGPLLGGLLLAADLGGLGWRTIFLLNLPVGLFTIVAVLRWYPRADTVTPGRPRLDMGSVVMASLGLLLLIFPLVQGPELGWSAGVFALMALAVPVLLATVRRQLRRSRGGRYPLIAMSLFRRRSFVAGGMANFLLIGGVSSFFLVFVVYLQSGLDYAPERIGIVSAAWAIAAAVASGATVPLARRVGRPMLVAGAALMAVAMAALGLTLGLRGEETSTWIISGLLALGGLGQGMLSPPLYNLTVTDVPKADVGSASGVFGMLTQVGAALGVAIVGAVFYGLLGGADSAAHYTRAMALTLVCHVACFLAVAVILQRFLPRPARRST
ncbi:MFS transporter [Couchioplanes caeruleus]|uniref:Drug resistance transporter n=2 Tax=Couchioplanes caeruleus TaxID=56438 RepID=A0A1K0FTL7_9ACTN|nr:MFS transporter [Couchioplanes caeruleus]OJF16149.1 Drug resistance transporter [Couchioplanes caeruleus subsp. caeruleus]ROP34038.1 EmrB/QacA subfamily drug resistance transporter [Couchioplanes caeruleus]